MSERESPEAKKDDNKKKPGDWPFFEQPAIGKVFTISRRQNIEADRLSNSWRVVEVLGNPNNTPENYRCVRFEEARVIVKNSKGEEFAFNYTGEAKSVGARDDHMAPDEVAGTKYSPPKRRPQ